MTLQLNRRGDGIEKLQSRAGKHQPSAEFQQIEGQLSLAFGVQFAPGDKNSKRSL